jgi:uncharacterized protein with PIN domain
MNVTLRFYAELNDFLPPERRARDWSLACEAHTPIRHLIEGCGVPHTEVELILRNGESIDLEARVADGDRIAVYPMFEAFDVRPLLRLRPAPLRRPCFLADAHFGALARGLRMLGFDTLWHNDLGDAALVRLAMEQRRILLTRDRRLLMRRGVTHGCYVPQGPTDAQLAALLQRLQLCGNVAPFTRCIACNDVLAPFPAVAAQELVPPAVAERHRSYWRCPGCNRIYWKGTHWQAMCQRIETLCPGAIGPDAGRA